MTVPTPATPRPRLDWFAALLSYLIPGLGQIYQGRYGKGALFMVSLLVLFFYGMWLGEWRNVYLPDTYTEQNMIFTMKPLGDIENRPHFAGQFFIGVTAWPAVFQYVRFDPKVEHPSVIGKWMRQPYDPRYGRAPGELDLPSSDPRFPNFQANAGPPWAETAELNDLQNRGDKRWDLGWVYTVIAGVLNILVIYDAFAGPAVRTPAKEETKGGAPAPQPVGAK